jgi:protein O-GlcNAc transferase
VSNHYGEAINVTTAQTMSLNDALQQALAHHQAGRLPEAEELYRAILQAHPDQADANHNLGVLAGQVGQHAAGLPYLKNALMANPNQAQYVRSYAEALLTTGSADAAFEIVTGAHERGVDSPALQALRQTLAAVAGRAPAPAANSPVEQPGQQVKKSGGVSLAELLKGTKAAAHTRNSGKKGKSAGQPAKNHALQSEYELANLLNARRYGELEVQARNMIERHAGSGTVWKMLGIALQMQGKDSLAVWQKAVELLPNDEVGHCNLGLDLAKAGQLQNAAASYSRAIQCNPGLAEAHYGLGNALYDLRQVEQAVTSYRRAVEINPAFADAHNNLGNALKTLGQSSAAIAHFRKSLELKPECAEAHNNLGNTLKNVGQVDEALASYQRAISLKPDYAEAHSNLAIALTFIGQLEQAAVSYRRAIEIKPDFADARGSLLYIHNYLSNQPNDALMADARRYGDLVNRMATPYTSWPNTLEPDRCLHVGLVSADLRMHPVGFFVESMLAALASQAKGRIEVIAYSNHTTSDVLSERIKASCHAWRVIVGLADAQVAQQIIDDKIDILIDLSGHTDQSRLPVFAWKPAPVQASWLGYFATTGVAAMDYFIADPWTAPPAVEPHFTEKILRLPESYICFTAPDIDVPVAPLPALKNGFITFGCFNNLTKMNDAVVALWARVLQAVPNSRLLLKTKQLNNPTVRQNVLDRFARQGIQVGQLMLESAAPRAELLATYNRVDIALDPFPYPGGTTSVEALWMATPVLSLAGDRFLSHLGESILHNAGLPDWIATDADNYVAKAVAHAGDVQALATLRSGLRQQVLASPLFDAPRFARHFESTLRSAWTQWCRQQTQNNS